MKTITHLKCGTAVTTRRRRTIVDVDLPDYKHSTLEVWCDACQGYVPLDELSSEGPYAVIGVTKEQL